MAMVTVGRGVVVFKISTLPRRASVCLKVAFLVTSWNSSDNCLVSHFSAHLGPASIWDLTLRTSPRRALVLIAVGSHTCTSIVSQNIVKIGDINMS